MLPNLRNLITTLVLVFLLSACSGRNVFESACDVGNCKLQGSHSYDGGNDTYTLTGAGTNIWGQSDEFYMVWKKVSGDFTISARIAFDGKGVHAHRKMGLMVRESLLPGARYADVAVHGDGLTSLQYRREKDDLTLEIKSEQQFPDHIVLERKGETILMKTGTGVYPELPDANLELNLPQECYVGLFICSHDPEALETGYFSDVNLKQVVK